MSITRSSFLQSAGVHAVQGCTPCTVPCTINTLVFGHFGAFYHLS
ncbi:hypothetical protein LINPERHAP2_LOCUS19506 [Linum perenne]